MPRPTPRRRAGASLRPVYGVARRSTGYDTAASTRLLSLVVEADVRLIRFEHVRPTLEDVFLRLVGRRPESKVA